MRKSLSFLLIAGIASMPTISSAQNNAASTNLGEYREVECSTRSEFASCDQCFEGGSVSVGKQLNGLFDNWSNDSDSILTAYKDEQKEKPSMQSVNSTWKSTPDTEKDAWVYGSDVNWKPGSNGENFILTSGQKVQFWETDLGAGYTLTETSQEGNDLVGVLKFPVVYHATSLSTGEEGAAKTHYECVAYTLNKTAEVAPTPVTPADPKPAVPKEALDQETGPAETLLLIVAAFFIAFGLMISLRKKA